MAMVCESGLLAVLLIDARCSLTDPLLRLLCLRHEIKNTIFTFRYFFFVFDRSFVAPQLIYVLCYQFVDVL